MRDLSSMMRATHHVFRINPFTLAPRRRCRRRALEFAVRQRHREADLVAFFSRFADAGVTPLSIGGDHSITYAILKGIVRDGPVGLVHIDAHTDTLGPIQGVRFHHGAPFRNAIEDGLIDPRRMVQIGIRGAHNVFGGLGFLRAPRRQGDLIEEFDALGVAETVEIARAAVGAGPPISRSTSTRSTPRSRPAPARRKPAG